MMKVAVLGGGHGCYAAAAEMTERGHKVWFWRRNAAAFGPVVATKRIAITDFRGHREVEIHRPTHSLEEAVSEADLILTPLPATAQEDIARAIAPLLRSGQVVFLPPGTFGSYIFARALRESGNHADVAFAETGTLPNLVRKHGAAAIVVSGYGKHLPTGIFPGRLRDSALNVLRAAYPGVEPVEDVLSAALMNAGPIIHPPLILMNAGPLEHFPAWDIHNEGTQPSIRRVTDTLDDERILVREALGYGPPHFPLRDHYAKDGAEWMYGRAAHEELTASGDWRESIDLLSHRYMLEDTKLGLSLIVSVARWIGADAPVARGLLSIASAVAGHDFYRTGRTFENLGLAGLTRRGMVELLETGI